MFFYLILLIVLFYFTEKNPPIDEVIASGAIPPLVAVLNQDQDANNQFEAAWALTNVASGSTEQTRILLANVSTIMNFIFHSAKCNNLFLLFFFFF